MINIKEEILKKARITAHNKIYDQVYGQVWDEIWEKIRMPSRDKVSKDVRQKIWQEFG